MNVTLGFDVEEFDFPLERGREIDLGTQLSVSAEGLEFLLELLSRLDLRATFYTTANFALNRTDLVRRIVAGGHEVASHDYCHGLTAGADPAGSRRVLEELTGQRIVGYRAPRLAVASSAALRDAGYAYNSSVNPTWIPTRYNNLRAPRSVSQEEGLTIYPVSVSAPFRVPLFWISLHVMPLPIYKRLCRSALRRDGHLNLYFHPWEFSARLGDPAFGVPGYLTHCSGEKLQRKFTRLLEWLKARGCRFSTTREYLGCDE
ncbi:polysaccharide deacetylase family protein [Alistipes provencensis]|uniref:polysaccharide deacetylase family protein n=1 Tax=Alistipes provencensis TaxID=1816676 RepID=UPI0007ED357D|nr:polysaccharide deacetylase family protein [Alistipes provencensis]